MSESTRNKKREDYELGAHPLLFATPAESKDKGIEVATAFIRKMLNKEKPSPPFILPVSYTEDYKQKRLAEIQDITTFSNQTEPTLDDICSPNGLNPFTDGFLSVLGVELGKLSEGIDFERNGIIPILEVISRGNQLTANEMNHLSGGVPLPALRMDYRYI